MSFFSTNLSNLCHLFGTKKKNLVFRISYWIIRVVSQAQMEREKSNNKTETETEIDLSFDSQDPNRNLH